ALTQGQTSNQTVSITMPGTGGGGGGVGNFQNVGNFHIGDLFMSGDSGRIFQYLAGSSPPYSTTNNYNTNQNEFESGMAFDSQGNLYVTDWGAANVTEFSPSGTLIGTFGHGTNWPGYAHPESIAFDAV